jgi:Heparan-alpha-glucosaminide N-acetyltransferase, catalytic
VTATRSRPLDIFRGVTIASMILVNNPGSSEDAYPPLLHAQWDGWTFADTVFPVFLWIVGASLTLSTAARVERRADRSTLLKHAVRRSVLLSCCGVLSGRLVDVSALLVLEILAGQSGGENVYASCIRRLFYDVDMHDRLVTSALSSHRSGNERSSSSATEPTPR